VGQPPQRTQAGLIFFALICSNLFALFVTFIFEFLSLRGVVHLGASIVVLLLAWGCGVVIISAFAWGTGIRAKWITVLGGSFLLAASLWALDAWTPKPDTSASPATLSGVDVLLRKYFGVTTSTPAPGVALPIVPRDSSPEPEVVIIAPKNTLYNFEWVPAADLAPRINLAGDPNNPVLELKKLTSDPVVALTLDWSAPSPQGAFLSSPHFARYKPQILEDGWYSLSPSGPSLRAADSYKEHIEYIADDPVKVSIPSLIWNGFELRFIASQIRPIQKGEQGADRHDQTTVSLVSVDYHVGSRSFIRRFRIEAAVTAYADGVLYAGFHVATVPPRYESPDNLRATLQFSVIELPDVLPPRAISPSSSSPDDPRVQFTSSPLWTDARKDSVRVQVKEFDKYLTQYKIIEPPKNLPLFFITTATQFGYAVSAPADPPFDGRQIPVSTKFMTPLAIRRQYGDYVFDIILGSFATADNIPLARDAWVYSEYFAASSVNSAPPQSQPLKSWQSALWDIRKELGQDFADRSLMYSLKAPVARSDDFDKEFRERLWRGVEVVKNNEDQTVEVNKILQRHALLR